MNLFGNNEAKTAIDAMKRGLGEFETTHLNMVIAEVRAWQQDSMDGSVSYADSMQTRLDYLDQAMSSDMKKHFMKWWPETWKKIQQVNVGLIAYIYSELAMAFQNSKFVLLDTETNEPINDDTESPALKSMNTTFDTILKKANITPTLIEMDAMTQICQRSAARVYWDDEQKCIEVCAYGSNKVFILPNPDREWDPTTALWVGFERPGRMGLSDSEKRYEIFCASAEDLNNPDFPKNKNGARIYEPKLHYVTDGRNPEIFDDGTNPYKDTRTSKNIVPFIWLAADAVNMIYPRGKENVLDINRRINEGLATFLRGVSWQGLPVTNLIVDERVSSTEMPKSRILSPEEINELPEGVRMEVLHFDLQLEALMNLYDSLAMMEGHFNSLRVDSLTNPGGSEESGRALKIKNNSRDRRIKRLIPIYQPHIDRLLEVICIVWNTHNEEGMRIDLKQVQPKWVPGEVDYPSDPGEELEIWEQKISNNAATIVEYVAEKYKLTMDEAKQKVIENKAINDEFRNSVKFGVDEEDKPDNVIDDAENDAGDKDKEEPTPNSNQATGNAPDMESDIKKDIDRAKAVDTKAQASAPSIGDTTNVYQLAKLVEMNVTDPIELRMIAFGETEDVARIAVEKATSINDMMSAVSGKQEGLVTGVKSKTQNAVDKDLKDKGTK